MKHLILVSVLLIGCGKNFNNSIEFPYDPLPKDTPTQVLKGSLTFSNFYGNGSFYSNQKDFYNKMIVTPPSEITDFNQSNHSFYLIMGSNHCMYQLSNGKYLREPLCETILLNIAEPIYIYGISHGTTITITF